MNHELRVTIPLVTLPVSGIMELMRRIGQGLVWGVLLWALLALACNAPLTGPATIAPPPVATTAVPLTPTSTAAVTATAAATEPAPATAPLVVPTLETTAVSPTLAPLPTFTPIAAPTLAATPTPPSATAVPPAATATPRATNTPVVQGTLQFNFQISWRFAPDNPFLVIGSVAIQAQGGNGVYTYYHDEIRQPGPNFEFNWAACRAKPGSLRVDSGDGQSVRQEYYQEPPCPTPTPGP